MLISLSVTRSLAIKNQIPINLRTLIPVKANQVTNNFNKLNEASLFYAVEIKPHDIYMFLNKFFFTLFNKHKDFLTSSLPQDQYLKIKFLKDTMDLYFILYKAKKIRAELLTSQLNHKELFKTPRSTSKTYNDDLHSLILDADPISIETLNKIKPKIQEYTKLNEEIVKNTLLLTKQSLEIIKSKQLAQQSTQANFELCKNLIIFSKKILLTNSAVTNIQENNMPYSIKVPEKMLEDQLEELIGTRKNMPKSTKFKKSKRSA